MTLTGINQTQYRESAFKYYTYKDGKGQEESISLKDSVEISLPSFTVPVGSETYEELKTQLKSKPMFPSNKMFYETMDVMRDFYAEDLSKDEVKNIYKEYCYHMLGEPGKEGSIVSKEHMTNTLSKMYEYFSRANTRAANNCNYAEAVSITEENGMSMSGTTYYNSDYYYKCQEMQEMFREVSDELASAYNTEKVDFASVEKNTIFGLDGGITYNGVWNWNSWQNNHLGMERTSYISDETAVPPRGFQYLAGNYFGKSVSKLKESFNQLGTGNFLNTMILIATQRGAKMSLGSLLLDSEKFTPDSDRIDENLYQSGIAFLEKFHIKYGSDKVEILRMEKTAYTSSCEEDLI